MDYVKSDEKTTTVNIVLVGIGGYGENYVNALMNTYDDNEAKGIKLIGIVEPFPERCSSYELLKERKIPIFSKLDEFYEYGCADLAVISTPIHLHTEQVIYCLSKGSNVLCEKPLCADSKDCFKLLEAEKRYGKFVGIGFQLSYSNAVQEMKKDIMSGLFGKVKSLKALLLMPRGEEYYSRSGWAGKIKAKDGKAIYDSPVNNACAHQLHNMLYILGETRETSVNPKSITAELYRANFFIENYDTAAIRCITKDNTEILFYTTHASEGKKIGPKSIYEFEKGTIYHENGDDENFYAVFNNGLVKRYGEIPKSDRLQKLWDSIDSVKSGKKPACTITASIPHVLCVNGAQESMPEIGTFPDNLLKTEGEVGKRKISVMGIEKDLMECFEKAKLPSEIGIAWSKPAKEIDITENYL
jgi:Predicted dehydrogenases and related proteins